MSDLIRVYCEARIRGENGLPHDEAVRDVAKRSGLDVDTIKRYLSLNTRKKTDGNVRTDHHTTGEKS